ncbi:MAG: hypothetical protein EU529_05740 [Promethearchaeota archaeon]|nr:MAG: hypothetical protein EU529_05740 [Candidatus Lokiarchaeota archaeon]
MIKESFIFKEDLVEGKSLYPYLTIFKKEPFKSFFSVKSREIGPFYISNYDEVLKFYQNIKENILNEGPLNLENVYYFLLLRKYLKDHKKEKKKELYDYIKKCKFTKGSDKLGFKFSPYSNQKEPDIWSTYFALASLKLLGVLKEFLASKGQKQIAREIKNFVLPHNKGDRFLHCFFEDCEICKKTSSARTLYFALEILRLLGIDTRLSKDSFQSHLTDKKRDPSLVFKLLCFKLLDLDSNVNDKSLQYLHQFQKENGGFSFKKIDGTINTTFWLVYVLDIYSWLIDYNPIGIYSFINSKLNEILSEDSNRNLIKMMELSKLIIILSIIWKKFINTIERVLFKQLEQEEYVDSNQIKTSFGLTHGIEEVISYINEYYTFNIRILDNQLEFNNYIRDLSPGLKDFALDFYDKIKKNSIVSFKKKNLKKFKSKYHNESFKLKEDIFPLINNMIERNFFKGKTAKNRFELDFLLEKIIVSDTKINPDRLFSEKEKLKEIKNNIFNMILKLKNVSSQIKEEIESYLILNEIDLAKERLKFILRDALMEADFLNENIENSFNEDLYYTNIQTVFESEITHWNELYSILSKELKDTELFLLKKISEKEDIRKFNNTIENLENKITIFRESIDRDLDKFRNNLREVSEKYSDTGLSVVIQDFEKIRKNVNEFDKKFYEISRKIITEEKEIIQNRNEVINHWIEVKKGFNDIFDYYSNGFTFFRENVKKINNLKSTIIQEVQTITEKAKIKAKESQFKEAFEVIKIEANNLLKTKTNEIKELQEIINKEIKSKQRLSLLYKQLNEGLEDLEENLLTEIAQQVKSLKKKVVEERNRAKIEDFDDFVSQEISKFKDLLKKYKDGLDQPSDKLGVKDINNRFDDIRNQFNEVDRLYLKKLKKCNDLIEKFEEKSNVTIIQWNNFKEYFNHEVDILKEEYINNVITEKINSISNERKTNTIKVIELKKELGLKCNVLMSRIKEMIEISKLNAKLYDTEKCVLLYTDHYYKNKELKNYIDNKLLKLVRERIGKILALYDSSIRKRTLSVNILELQNRINELNFEETVREQFKQKVKELQIEQTRMEFIDTKNYFESVLENNKLAINKIRINLELFINKQNFITQEFNNLETELKAKNSKISKDIEKSHGESYIKIKESFENEWRKLANKFNQTQQRIEEDLKSSLSNINDSNKMGLELSEYFVKKKSEFLKDYENKKEKISTEIIILKEEVFRGKLTNFINEQKMRITQMLGTLQIKIEEDIDAQEFKRAYYKINDRASNISTHIKLIKKNIKNLTKEFNKDSKDFKTKSKYLLKDFDRFLKNFYETLTEKIKSLEQLIIKSYVTMAIKAVANEYLTVGFLANELKIKKQNLQEHLIYLISSGDLKGKYDPRLGLYYENPDVLDKLDEDELEVFKKMNFRVYMFWKRFKSFTSLYGPIIGFFASLLAITYYIFIFSGGNPVSFAIPILFVLVIIFYFIFKKGKEEKVKI